MSGQGTNQPQIIPPLGNLPTAPDKETSSALKDMTAARADNRVLYINCGIFRYGTDDKIHAAALLFAFFLLLIIVGLLIVLVGADAKTEPGYERAFNWATGTFLFVLGIALGKTGGSSKDD